MTVNVLRSSRAPKMGKYAMPYLFIAVPVLSTLVFLLIPMVVSFWWSLNDYSGIQPPRFIGLQNYIELFTEDKYFIQSLWNTTVFVLLGMGIGPTLGLLTAILLNQKVYFQSLFRTAYYLPVMTSLVVVSTIWVMLYNQNGLFNTILTNFGFKAVGWLSNPNVALVSVVIASIWQGFGFETVIFLAALQSTRVIRSCHDRRGEWLPKVSLHHPALLALCDRLCLHLRYHWQLPGL